MFRVSVCPSQILKVGSIAVLAAVIGCAESAPPPTVVEPTGVAEDPAQTIRQGPYRVTCYKDDAVVFEHGTIYRVYRPDGDDSGWSYETGDGLKYRGRIGENVNCVWQ